MKMRFYTKFDLPEKSLREFDRHDNVDRLTYCDNTIMIQRFMEAGKNLMYSNGQAMYKDVKSAIEDKTEFATPVYQEDPVILQEKIDEVSESVKTQLVELNALEDESAKRSESAESSKVEPSSVTKSNYEESAL